LEEIVNELSFSRFYCNIKDEYGMSSFLSKTKPRIVRLVCQWQTNISKYSGF